MEPIIIKSLELQRQAHQLLFFEDDEPVYSDVFCKQNREVLALSEDVYSLWENDTNTISPVEEAEVCLSLLMGYNATIYDHGDKQEHIQKVLDRCWQLLETLPGSLLKVRLLTYCYAEVFDEELAKEAHAIMASWTGPELTAEEIEVIELLKNLEANPYPWTEVGEENDETRTI